jgi:indole-3-glycerol phosphate synthase
MGFLTDHVAEVRRRLEASPLPHETLADEAARRPVALDVVAALSAAAEHDGVALIAEVKRASPSAGDIAVGADPVVQARAYDSAGVAAISVLTEPASFGGTLGDLRAVRASVPRPLLRKDFLVHPDQVLESRAAGADTVLLIVACLDDGELSAMLAEARRLGMEPLVETHGDRDLDRALATDARLVGVNARDLESLEVDLPAALARVRRIADGRIAVAESGIRTRDDVRAASDAGASAILVGEALMRAGDPTATARALIHGKEQS